jgi:hypothetical protein
MKSERRELVGQATLLWNMESTLPANDPLRSRIEAFYKRLAEWVDSGHADRLREATRLGKVGAMAISDADLDQIEERSTAIWAEMEELIRAVRQRVQ